MPKVRNQSVPCIRNTETGKPCGHKTHNHSGDCGRHLLYAFSKDVRGAMDVLIEDVDLPRDTNPQSLSAAIAAGYPTSVEVGDHFNPSGESCESNIHCDAPAVKRVEVQAANVVRIFVCCSYHAEQKADIYSEFQEDYRLHR